jgi:hypothetical protein
MGLAVPSELDCRMNLVTHHIVLRLEDMLNEGRTTTASPNFATLLHTLSTHSTCSRLCSDG